MHSYIATFALLAGYAASAPAPAPQVPDFDLIYEAPTPSLLGPPPVGGDQTSVFDSAGALASATADVTAVASASSISTAALNEKRNPQSATASTTTSPTPAPTTCKAEPDGYGPKNLTVNQFQHWPEFTLEALFAQTPKGYTNTFRNLNASVQANSYLGYYDLKSYDTELCSQHCANASLCTAFNIYVERDPSVNPNKDVCPDPDAITNYKCALWGSGIDKAAATNDGQYRANFHVVIEASNGYDKTNNTTPAPCPGWTPPTHCGGAISALIYFLIAEFFPGPFDPALCAAYAETQTSYNRAHTDENGKYSPANMFNAYTMHKNGVAQGTYCSLYSTVLDKSHGTYTGGWVGNDFFGVQSSWTYSLTEQDKGSIY